MENNFGILFLAALVPLAMGFVWFHPKVFGTRWAKMTQVNPENSTGAQMARIFIMTYIFSLLICFSIPFLVVHQSHYLSVFMNDPQFGDKNSELWTYINTFYEKYGSNFRTFKHGAFHGFLAGVTFAGSILGINSLFERRSAGFILINMGYWTISFMLMGGIISAWY